MALHVIASPKGAAISFSMGLLRRSAPRNDGLFIAFVLETKALCAIGGNGNPRRDLPEQFLADSIVLLS